MRKRPLTHCEPLRGRGPAAARPVHLERLVDDDAQEPGPELASQPEAADRPVCFHEPLLSGVFGLIRIAQDQKGGPKGALLVAAHKLLEGGGVALLSGGDERFVLQRSPLAKSTPQQSGWFPMDRREKGERRMRKWPAVCAPYPHFS